MLARAGLVLDQAALDRLWRFHDILRQADEVLNLTRIRGFEAMVEKHYIDSLLPATLTTLPQRVMDLGSGGGFPGIPLAIAHPEHRFVLVEGRRKRAAFLEHTARELGLGNVEVIARKLNPRDAIPVDGVITRAFAAADDTLERVAGSLPSGGRVLLMKGPNCDDEIAEVAARDRPFRLTEDHSYTLPFGGDRRRLLVFEHTAQEADEAGSEAAGLSRPEPGRDAETGAGGGATAAIESPRNERFRHWLGLLDGGRAARRAGETILAGEKLVREFLSDPPAEILGVLAAVDHGALETPDATPWFRLTRERFDELDFAGTNHPILWVAAPEPEPWDPNEASEGLRLCLPLQLPDNLGAVLRCAEAFAVPEVVLLQGAANPFHPRGLRAAGLAPWRLRLRRGPALEDLGPATGIDLRALDTTGDPLDPADWPARTALILGREGPGTRGLHADIPRCVIPTPGRAESLNAAVAAGIALYAVATAGRG